MASRFRSPSNWRLNTLASVSGKRPDRFNWLTPVKVAVAEPVSSVIVEISCIQQGVVPLSISDDLAKILVQEQALVSSAIR